MKNILLYIRVSVLSLFFTGFINAQTTVFSDDFSTNQSASYATSGAISFSNWIVLRSTGNDWGARRNTTTSQLELTNDISASANNSGWVLASTTSSSFSSPYTTTLGNNTGIVTWTFNMRQITADPGGFSAGLFGVAYILSGDSGTNNNTGTGYAVVLGQATSTDPIRLVRYTSGIQGTMTNIITSNTSGLNDFGAQYVSVKVTYDPVNDQWELFLRNDGTTAFADPATGTLTSQGTATDATYVASALPLMGAWWQGANTASQTAFFDNCKVTVATTPFLTVAPNTLAFGSQLVNTNSFSETFNLSGVNLVSFPANVTVTAPSQFQVSNDNSTWGSSTTIAYTSATLVATPVYVRFSPTSTGAKSGNITFSVAGGSTFHTIALTGTCPATANVKTWAGGASGNWNTTGNWSPSGVPAAGDVVIFNTPSAIAVALNAAPNTISNLIVSGSAAVTITATGAARTLTVSNAGTTLDIESGSTLILDSGSGVGGRDMTLALTGNGNSQIAGTLAINSANGGDVTFNTSASTTNVTGTVRNSVTTGFITSTAANLIFASGATYNHARNAGIIPTASWNMASTCNITGITSTIMTSGLAQSFGNFTWNCANQSGDINNLIGAGLVTINGDFTIASTNASILNFNNTTTLRTLNIAGNYNQTGGNADFNSSSGTTIVNVAKNIAVLNTATITTSTSTTATSNGTFVVNGTGTQTINYATPANVTYVNITVNSGATLELLSGIVLNRNTNAAWRGTILVNSGGTIDCGTQNVSATGTNTNAVFTISSGAKMITSNATGVQGSVTTTNITATYNSGASYEFKGSNTGIFALTTANMITGTLTFNRSAGVTIDQNFIASTLVLTSGIVTTGANSITIASGGTYTGASSTTYINGILKRVYPSATTLVFPVGKGGNYRPLTFQYTALTGTSTVTVEQNETALTGTLPASTNLNNARTWDVSQTGGSAFAYKLSIDGTGDTVSGTVVMLKKETTISSNATTTPNYTNTTGFTTLTGTNNFTLGSACSVSSTAGANQSLCVGTTAIMAANTPSFGSGVWSVAGPSTLTSQFSNTTSPTAVFTPAGGAGNYTLTWTVNNGNCSANSNLTVSVGTTKTWNGTSWSPSAPTSIDAAVISGNYTTSASPSRPSITACTLTVNSSAAVVITSGYNVTLNGALTVSSGSFTLENNANLIQTSNASNSGNIVVKRNSSALKRQDYTLWSSPVLNQNLLAFSPQTVATRFYGYNSSTDTYASVTPSTNVFAEAQGYLIRMPNNHPATATIWNGQFTGVPNNGDYSVNMTAGIYNLVGNPYPSPISMATFVSQNSSAINGTLYFWRETNNTTANNAYCTWAGGTFTSNGQAEVYNPSGIIQAGQGFFVAANSIPSTVTFRNTQRVSNFNNQFFRDANEEERNTIWLNATNADGGFSQMAVGYITDATQGIDVFDGKFFGNGELALNSILENSDYVIQGRALPFDAADVVPLSFRAATAGTYTIAIDHAIGLFEGSQDIFLKDNAMNETHNLKTTPYTFVTEAGTFSNRFELVYQDLLAIQQPLFNANNVVVYKQHQQLVINSGKTIMDNVKVFDIRGRLLAERNNVNAFEVKIATDSVNQVLIVKITSTDNNTITKKVIN